jgi:4-carboxymuconolactone decarboxylase
MPRVTPISSKSDVPADYHSLVDGVLKVFGGIRGPFSMLLHSPKMAQSIFDLGSYFREHSIVPAKLRTLAILVAAASGAGVCLVGAGGARANREQTS